MKTTNRKKLLLICAILFIASNGFAENTYPPKNAAVLYYQAFLLYKPDEKIQNAISDYSTGKNKSTEQIREYIKQNQDIIQLLTDAANTPECNWGLDFSQGFDLKMPYLAQARNISRLLAADALLLAEQNEYKKALQRCMTMKKMSCHIGDDLLISYLVSVAINAMANGRIQDILNSDIDIETLKWLKSELEDIQKRKPSVKNALINDFEIASRTKREKLRDFPVESVTDDPNLQKKLNEVINNKSLFEENFKYWEQYIRSYTAAFDLPYLQAVSKMKEMESAIPQQSKGNINAVITAIFAPPAAKIFTLSIRDQANENAVKVAVDIFIRNAQNSKLPDSLPAGLPKDIYSGEDFDYAKTKEGFILRCRQKDLDKDKIQEYEFKLKR